MSFSIYIIITTDAHGTIASLDAVYYRYVDDCFITTEKSENILTLDIALRQASVLNFTHEISETQQLHFLDAHVDGSQSTYKTAVYKKPTEPKFT